MNTFTTPLSDKERADFHKLKAAAELACADEVAKVKAAYKAEQVAKLIAEGKTEVDATNIVESRMNHCLQPNDELVLADGSIVTALEVLEDMDSYDGKSLCDPLEPEKGSSKAVFYANHKSGRPVIFSQVHGGITYSLVGSFYRIYNRMHASGMVKGKYRIARIENNKLTFCSPADLKHHYAGVDIDEC